MPKSKSPNPRAGGPSRHNAALPQHRGIGSGGKSERPKSPKRGGEPIR